MKNTILKIVTLVLITYVFVFCTNKSKRNILDDVFTPATNNPTNEFVINGDGYTNDYVSIDTSYTCAYDNSFLFFHIDSIQFRDCFLVTINGNTEECSMQLNTHFTGSGTYPYGGVNNTALLLSLRGRSYSGNIGSMEIDTLNPAGYMSGTYSGTFVDLNNAPNTVTITGGKYIVPLVIN